MRGRGAVPEPEAVNHIAWLVLNYMKRVPDRYIVVHCTHGFNRTGEIDGVPAANNMRGAGLQ